MNKLSLRRSFKNLLKRENNSLLSIIGLSIAFATAFHIYAFVCFELGYDRQYQNTDRIYRISGDIVAAENTMTHAVLGPLFGPGLKSEFSAIESVTSLVPFRQSLVLEANDFKYEIEEAYAADTSVFDMFSVHFIYGNKNTALKNPNEIIINKSLSEVLFGKENPVGRTLVENKKQLTIVGVINDSPENTHHKLNVLLSVGNRWAKLEGLSPVKLSEAYWMPSAYHFVKLHEHAKIEDVTGNFDPFYQKYMVQFGEALNAKFVPVAVPLKDLHFSRHMSYDYPKGNRTYTYIFFFSGLFILLIATINYINFVISQNIIQSKDIGIRKIVGASSTSLFLQFFLNSIVFIATSLLISLIIYNSTQPILKQITSMDNIIPVLELITISLVLLFIISFTASLISFVGQHGKDGLRLIHFKQKININKTTIQFGKTSTIVQFSLSIILLIGVFVVTRQLNFLLSSDMGFEENNVVLLKLPKGNNQLNAFSEQLIKNPNVSNVAFSSHAPGDILYSNAFQIDHDGQKVTKIVNSMVIDYNYIPLMNMELKEGRNFDIAFNDAQQNTVIINEAFVSFCGFTDNMVGKEVAGRTVIGVLKDVCFNSLHDEAEPVIFRMDKKPEGYLNIKLRPSINISEAVNSVKNQWETSFSNMPFEIQFLENRIKMMYADDQNKSMLIHISTIISLIISLMGLFNLSSILTKRKTKEIGIRKVNGATISETLILLNRDFVKWVAIAFVIATPIAWYAMHRWLENFAYKTELSWWIFALAGLLALGVTLVTVSWQSWKAATRNPVEALRYE